MNIPIDQHIYLLVHPDGSPLCAVDNGYLYQTDKKTAERLCKYQNKTYDLNCKVVKCKIKSVKYL